MSAPRHPNARGIHSDATLEQGLPTASALSKRPEKVGSREGQRYYMDEIQAKPQGGSEIGRRRRRVHRPTLLSVFLLISASQFLLACGKLQESPPAPAFVWSEKAIGYEDAGVATQASGDYIKLVGSGADIWGTHDEFYFMYTQVLGDFSITAKLESLDYPNTWSKAGLMVRDTLDASSTNVMIHTSGENGAVLQARLVPGGTTTNSAGKDHNVTPTGSWMRLTRVGSLVVGELSYDGATWRELGSYETALGEEVYIGLAVTAHESGERAVATFSRLEVNSEHVGSSPPVPERPIVPTPDKPTVDSGQQWVCGTEPLKPEYKPTYYVSTTGNDSNDGRSISTPFRTLGRAASAVRPGDVVWVRGGTYSPNVLFSRSGEAGRPIVFESYPGECAVLDGSGLSRPAQVRFVNVNYNIFRNFVVRNSPGQGIYLNNAHDNWITNVKTHDNALSGIQNVGGNRNRFSYFVAHDNYDPPTRGGDADGIGISSGQDNIIDHCVVYHNSDDGIDTWKSVNTLVERCIAFDNGYDGGDGNGIKAGGGNDAKTVVRFNIAFNNRVQGFNYNSSRNVIFEHNTAFDNGYWGFISGNSVIRNNIAYRNVRGPFQDNGGNSVTANTWNFGIGDPAFVSTRMTDEYFLSPAVGSPVAGRATPVPDGTADLGALPIGETIESYLGIPLRTILAD